MKNAKTATLIAALKAISSQYPQFKFTPVDRKKRPIVGGWEKGFTLDETINYLTNGLDGTNRETGEEYHIDFTGFGLITGELSGYLLAIDCDGPTAHELAEHFGGLLKTVSWTSGKEGRAQYLYLVPPEYREALKNFTRKVLETGTIGEQLELRYNSMQSVLPPSKHPETQGYTWTNSIEDIAIAELPTWVIEQILDEKPEQPTLDFNQPSKQFEAIPLIKCLSREHRDWVASGISQGGRNSNGAELARDLIGTELRLQILGISCSDSARALFDDYCDRCNPSLNSKERETIWNSAQKSNPTSCLSDDKLENCYKHWQRKQQQTQLINTSKPNFQTSGNTALKPEQQAETQSNVLQFPRQQPQLNIEDIEDELKTLAEQNLSKSKQQLKIIEIAKKYNLNPKELGDVNKNYLAEIEDTDSLDDIKTELDELLKNKNQSLNLSEYLPGHLVKISEFATRLRLRPETALTAFLATCSSLLKVGSKIHLSGYSNFSQPMGIYAAIVAEPSQQKSPLISEIILEPLSKLAEIEQQNFENELKNYQIEYQLWEQDKTSGGEPEKPVMRNHYITGSSQAGIRNLLDKQSQKGWGVLQISDELAGAYKNSGKSYNVGQMEDDLSYYDARGTSEALKDGLVTNNKKCLFSKFGGIQPGVIRDFLNGTDNNGYWSRWTFINQPVSPMFIPDDDDSSLTVQPMLTDFYNKLSELPLLQLRLEPKAEKQFNRIQNKCEVNRVNAKTPALAALWGKIRGKIGRYAALIHVIEQVALFGTVQSTDVNLATLKKAAALAKFYFNESQSLYAACTEGSLPATLDAIIDLAKRENAPITASKVKQFEKTIFGKIDVADIRVMFIKLSEMGHGQLEGSGSRLKFSNCSNCSKTVEGFSTVETPPPIGLHPTVVTVEEKNKFFTETNQHYLDVTVPLEVTEGSEKPSTVTTVGYNPDTVCDVAVETPSTVPTTVTTVSTVCSDRTPDPIENKIADFDGLDVGDVLIAEFKRLHVITARKGQQWLTHRGEYVSRTALQNQDFKVPTIDEMVSAIGIVFGHGDAATAHLLIKTFENDPSSLFCQAMAIDKQLELLYTL